MLLKDVNTLREHVARAISKWLNDAPRAVFLVSVNEPLAVPTERVIEVKNLNYPSYGESPDFNCIRTYSAGELFLKRALGFNRNLMGMPDASEAVGAITRLAGGNPLCLELLAGELETRSPDEIATQLTTALTHTGGTAIMMPDALVDQIVDWVATRQDPCLRATLSQLGTFSGGCTLLAAEAVVDLSRYPNAPTVAEALDRLVNRGLLQRSGEALGATRYSMHPAVQRMCEGLSEDAASAPAEMNVPVTTTEDRHGRYYAQLGATEALDALEQRGGWVRRARYVEDVHNATVALQRAEQRRDGMLVAACGLVVAAVQQMLGNHDATASTLVRAISLAETPEPMRMRCLVAQGAALARAGRYDSARSALERARVSLTAGEHPALLARCLCALGSVYLHQGHMQHAHSELEGARRQSIRCGDRQGAARAALGLAEIQRRNGDLTGTLRTLHEARVAFHELGAHRLYANTLEALGSVHVELGRHDAAHGAFEAALSLHRELGDRMAEARVLGTLGEHAFNAGQHVGAKALLEQAVARAAEQGAVQCEGRALGALGACYAATGEVDHAWRTWQRGVRILRTTEEEGAFHALAELLCRRAHFEVRRNARDEALGTLQEIESILVSLNAPPPPRLGRDVAVVRHRLGASVPPSMM